MLPMTALDEPAELAEDVKADGLRHSLAVAEAQGENMLVDGLNRRRLGVGSCVATCFGARRQPCFEPARTCRRVIAGRGRGLSLEQNLKQSKGPEKPVRKCGQY